MKARTATTSLSLLLALGLGVQAAQIAMPFPGVAPETQAGKTGGDRIITAFGDPGDFGAAAAAAADYLVAMQADITEDNAGNGTDGVDESPDDPDDGGWDWATAAFSHSTAASPKNIYGATANGLYRAYLADPRSEWLTAMQDAADYMLVHGPTEVRSGSDILFLLDFASIATNPAPYQAGAVAIWDGRIATYGTATALAEYIRDVRAGQGYENGIIPWDIGIWVRAAMALHAYDGMSGYDTAAADIAEVLYQDSIVGVPGYFDPDGANQGFDPTWTNKDFWWYSLGVTGLIDAFCASGTHTGEIAGLEVLLLDCQYANGAFSGSYGANPDDQDWQSTAYALNTLGTCLPGNEVAINAGAWWLGATQDASGGFVYGSGNHYPEIAGECAAGLTFASSDYTVTMDPASQHIAENDDPPYTDTASIDFLLSAGSEFYRSITVFVSYDPSVLSSPVVTQNFFPMESHYFIADDDANPMEISLALLGSTTGISGAANLFTIEFDGISDGIDDVSTLVHIDQVVMRDPANQDIFAAGTDDAVVIVDDLEPTLSYTTMAASCLDDDFDMDLTVGDNVNLGSIFYSIDGGGWVLMTAVSGTSDSHTFTVPAAGLGTGTHTVDFQVWDAVGYSYDTIAGLDTYTFYLDEEDPVAATDLTATPDDHAVNLTWTAGVDHDHYVLWRSLRPSYPYFGGRPDAGAFPADFAVIDNNVPAGDTSYIDTFASDTYATRGIYDYVLVAVDCALGNPDAASNMASATNYFLGDWAGEAPNYGYGDTYYDGKVCQPDLNFLALVYGDGSIDGDTDEIDMAPTHDYSRFGLPGPDGTINFEDLIVLAMNFRGTCAGNPLTSYRPSELAKDVAIDEASLVELSGAAGSYQLLLDGELLGLTVELETSARLLSVNSTHGMAMSYATEAGWKVDVVGLNELLAEDTVVELLFDSDASVTMTTVEGRDAFNQSILLESTDVVTGAQPVQFALQQNHPNPFNPTTSISYSLATDSSVRLALFNALGQQVKVLDEGQRPAGEHRVTLDASGLASGVYLYRLEAGNFVDQKKMVLIK